ncbi:MAG: hypothetical protein OXH31_09635 [Gammaproteobacteria bacterium]|nr:hypothetical protein [Gammaproteobacteria bacterium]
MKFFAVPVTFKKRTNTLVCGEIVIRARSRRDAEWIVKRQNPEAIEVGTAKTISYHWVSIDTPIGCDSKD